MSKLQEKIKRAGRTSPAPLGFTAASARTVEPTMLAVVRVSDAGKISEAAGKGADVIIIEKADAAKLGREIEKAGSASVGIVAERGSASEVASLREAGADFIVLNLESALAEALQEEKIGFVLSAGFGLDDIESRLLGDLTLDAVLSPAPEGPLTLRNALKLRRLSGLMRTPLLTPAGPASDASTLLALRDSGVVGVVVDGSDTGKLERLKETILKLRPRGRRREEHADATLPAGVAAGDDEDDWDD